ncbi:MAG TPA: thiamine phosphate synthase [Phycisphaerae bacterium]|nr:thiamine phosphate synthase [Phycisphaerae bacterium]
MHERDRQNVYRVVDANANRAREALRVAEEAARFALERADLAEALKRLRHDLRAALARLDAGAMIRARDTAGDVGTRLTTPAEAVRAGTADVARAAFKRLTEALRAIEEYGKTLDAPLAAAVEQLRYRAYDLEKRFEEAWRPRGRLAAGGVCVLLTESLCRRPWDEVLRGVLAGGAAAIQVREKDLADGALLARARQAAEAAHEAGALAIVNDRPDVAALAAADGVHVGQDDLAPQAARRIVGPERIVGVSTHSLRQAQAAAEAGADYVGCGPMFASSTKPQEVIPGPALAAEVARAVGLPIMAIGGIAAENAAEVLAAGPRWLAVSSTVCSAADPETATRRLVGIIGPRGSGPDG